ncbi:efflux RND transporter periplasmic adaptor subunit [Sphingosinicella soli]|uniref:Membrane fusion protein (Multidrug efflux system) n=1 Tax=Sphingosinicella soli TaxID=333708 RepID=A0A7W7AYJ5_9SPHN|nr:efflux RND transporter periplasmic adaptor subunit [Sphingosinicella soli]MBB4630614.1 membrane fusion protein (multidrug efflux system) [Sphingosinicella soli]
MSRHVVFALAVLLAACDGQKGGEEGRAPVVVGGVVEPVRFVDSIDAVGTAFARESTTLTSTVTERVESLRFTDGAYVQAGTVIAVLRAVEQNADLASAQARSREAEQQLGRLRELQQRGFATNASIDAQTAARDQARAQAGAIRAQIGDRIIRAPFSGVVGLRRLSPGSVVTAGTEIATISDISSIKLDFTVPERFISAIKAGQDIEARAQAWPGEVFRGTIEGVEPQIDPITRSVAIRALLPNTERRLHPGMLLTVSIVTNPRDALAVPELALVFQGDRQFVFRLDEKNVANRVPVEIGMRSGGMVEVTGGLNRGDRIVADGVVKVRDDAPVKPVFPGETGRTTGALSGAAAGAGKSR